MRANGRANHGKGPTERSTSGVGARHRIIGAKTTEGGCPQGNWTTLDREIRRQAFSSAIVYNMCVFLVVGRCLAGYS